MAHTHTRLFKSISDIAQRDWQPLEDLDSPFADWEFLKTLEDSGCVGESAGQAPRYLTIWRDQQLLAASMLYIKQHSYGEYIFDWSWAQAAAQAGIPYYPKLVSHIPFTPASCHKVLLHPMLELAARISMQQEILQETLNLTSQLKMHSTHLLFLAPDEKENLPSEMLLRHSFQYHWANNDYSSFDDFLKSLKSRKAKQIRKERLKLAALQIGQFTGPELSAIDGQLFYQGYLNTIDSKGAIPYLNEEFFRLIFERMKDRILLVKAHLEDGPVAQALFFFKGQKLYGRYWGPRQEHEFLHFELCYYQGMDFAIARGLKIFEAGAQGEHKISRGFVPTLTYSGHRLEHPGLQQAVAQFIHQEKNSINSTIAELKTYLPFKEDY